MNRLAVLLVLALTLPLTASADDASHRAKAEQLINLLHTDRMVKMNTDGLKKQLTDAANQVVGPSPTPAGQAQLSDFEKNASQMIDTQVGWTAMEPAFIDIYSKNYTEEELDAILAFYKTPAGAALLEKSPTVNDQATQIARAKMDALKPELMQSFTDFRKSQAPPAPTLGPVPAAPAVPASPVKPAAPATPPAPATSTPK